MSRFLKPGGVGGYSGYFVDPDGYLWEVTYNPCFPIDAEDNTWLG